VRPVVEPDWPHLRREGETLLTANARPGTSVYGEKLRVIDGTEYREWDPWRSKLAAYALRGGPTLPWAGIRRVLYLGGAHGTTVSHVADLLPSAEIFAVEKSPTSFGALLRLARARTNLLPLLADAHLPERYAAEVGLVQLLYQDVAQPDQAEIFRENALACLAPGGTGILFLKVRSVTQRKPPGAVIDDARRILRSAGLNVRATVNVAPFAREHVALLVS
jgi:fibrillarin-like pre-rRNA processing protein